MLNLWFTFINISNLVIFPPNGWRSWSIKDVTETKRRKDLGDLDFFWITEEIFKIKNAWKTKINQQIHKYKQQLTQPPRTLKLTPGHITWGVVYPKIGYKITLPLCKRSSNCCVFSCPYCNVPVSTSIVMPRFPGNGIVIQNVLGVVKTWVTVDKAFWSYLKKY